MRELFTSMMRFSGAVIMFGVEQAQNAIGAPLNSRGAITRFCGTLDSMSASLASKMDDAKRAAYTSMAAAQTDAVNRTIRRGLHGRARGIDAPNQQIALGPSLPAERRGRRSRLKSFLKERSPSPEGAFNRFGLRSRSFLREEGKQDAAYADLPEAARFRSALEELGGLYAAYGRFLCWRADLLRTEYLGRLRHIKVATDPIPVPEFGSLLSRSSATRGAALASALETTPCWNTLARCAYRAQFQGRVIAVQVARDPIPDSAFESFEIGLRLIQEDRLREAMTPRVLAGFREWMRIPDSPARERSYLVALGAMRERTLAQYPVLIPEISTERVLCFEWVDGESVAAGIANGSAEVVGRVAEYVLEQFCSAAAVDADFDTDSMVVTPSGKLALRRANRLLAIPAPLMHAGLKYISAVLASNAPGAAQMLVRLAVGSSNLTLEARLLDELSNLEPELKINLQFPASAAVFEGNWRALKRTGARTPLFLDMLHRNLIAVGYWTAETAPPPATPDAIAAAPDPIAAAQWPVMGRILRERLSDMVSRETASDWFIGSGLLFFESMRQINRLAEGLRENDISVGVDLQQGEDSGKTDERIRLGIFVGMLLLIFLGSLRFAFSAGGGWSLVLSHSCGGSRYCAILVPLPIRLRPLC